MAAYAAEFLPAINRFATRRITLFRDRGEQSLQFLRRQIGRFGLLIDIPGERQNEIWFVSTPFARGPQASLDHMLRQARAWNRLREGRGCTLIRQERAPKIERRLLVRRRGKNLEGQWHTLSQIHCA